MNIRLQLFALLAASVFSFATQPQTVVPQALSKGLTVSMQQATTETFDIDFQSTSATGKFLSASGGSASKVMARGTKSRTFYYEDSTIGEPTITVTATGRVSKQVFAATQNIVIASSVPTVKIQKAEPFVVAAPVEIAATTVVPSPQSATAVAIYSAPVQADPLDDFFALPRKIWKWFRNIF